MVLTPCSLICAQLDVEAWETPATADHWAKKDLVPSRQSLEADQTWGTPWNPPQKRSFLPENHQIFKPWSGTRGIQLDFQWVAIFEDVHIVWDGHFLISHIKNCHFGRVKPTLSDTYRTFYRYGSARFKPNTKPRFQEPSSSILRSFTWTKSLVNLSCPVMRIRRTNGGFQSMGGTPRAG